MFQKQKRKNPNHLKTENIESDETLKPCHSNNFLKNQIRKKNPNIFHFNASSLFIYEPLHSNYFFNSLENKNSIKPNFIDISLLRNIISYHNSENEKQIFVLPEFKLIMDNVAKAEPILSERDILIKSIIFNSNINQNISVKKVTEKYNILAESKGLKKLQKSSIHTIMRKKLFLHFKRKTIKNEKLKQIDFIKYSFFFLKIVTRAIKLNLKFIFLDESGFFLFNSHFRNWISKDDEIFFGGGEEHKVNLILAVSEDKVFYYKILKENTTSSIFKNYMDELIKNMSEIEKTNHVFILDNCSSHLTYELFKLYNENKLKVLFNVPYSSSFNMVENVFRLIKNKTYKKLYKDITYLIEDIKLILEDQNTIFTLKKLYSETIKVYLNYIEKNGHINLN